MEDAIKKLVADEKELTRQGVVLDFVKAKVDALDLKFDALKDSLDNKYVTHEEFDIHKKSIVEDVINPIIASVEKINTYIRWMVLLVFATIIGSILSLILKKP